MSDDPTQAARVRALGRQANAQTREASEALWAPPSVRPPADATAVQRDLRYGTHERHRLDVYGARKDGGSSTRPVLVYVHGGGFSGGDKHTPGGYMFDNIGHWAVSQGMLGVAMTYRLAPDHAWPAAAEDVAAALQWVIDNAAQHGADPHRIVIAGHSAGAAHIGDYLTMEHLNKPHRSALRGAVLISGVYDLPLAHRMVPLRAYYGETQEAQAGRSSMEALTETQCPLFVTVGQEEPYDMQLQSIELARRYGERHERLPQFVVARGHNHFSIVCHIGSKETELTDQIAGFVHDVTAA